MNTRRVLPLATDRQVCAFAVQAGLGPVAVARSTFDERLMGLHTSSLITITAPRSQ